MNLITTKIYEQIATAWLAGKRHVFIEGGTAASKTYSVLQFLTLVTLHTKSPLIVSVVSESVPHLKRGAMRDFMNILAEDFQDARWNRTDSIYTFGKGIIEFFSADEPSKLRGGRRDILFLNEANNIVYDGYRELDVRTRRLTIADWNPVSEFWAHQNNLLTDPANAYIHATYLDALNVIPPEVVANIESNKDRDPNWWNVYGLGKLGKIEGLVYPYFEQCDTLPAGDAFFGLDFGYSNDPSVLTKNVIQGEKLYSQELFYEAGLTNDAIAHKMDELGVKRNHDEIFADSAEPKSIDEIHKFGFNIKPAPKGEGSVEFGHQKVRQYKQFWTKDSLNGIKEQRNFRYIADKDGKFTEKTTHQFSHGMDSRRYAVIGFKEGNSFGAWDEFIKRKLSERVNA